MNERLSLTHTEERERERERGTVLTHAYTCVCVCVCITLCLCASIQAAAKTVVRAEVWRERMGSVAVKKEDMNKYGCVWRWLRRVSAENMCTPCRT